MSVLLLLLWLPDPSKVQTDVGEFLDQYNQEYTQLYYAAGEAEWAANTRIVEGDDTNQKAVEKTAQALAAFTGSVDVIEKTREFLQHKEKLTDLQVRQLNTILYTAANNPQTVKELVNQRIAAEAKQNEALFGFDFKVDGKSVTANDLDDMLVESTDLKQRLKAWRASKEVGPTLKNGLAGLVGLRNKTVQALGYDNYFDYQVSDYGMTTDELIALMDQFVEEVRPLYRELHTWARYELAERYGAEEVPDQIPAHWLPNRWGQDWTAMVTVEGLDLDGALANKSAEWVVKQGEAFYVSLGFDPLPASFYSKSSLYPLPADASYKKNNHASAWHLDLDSDVRSLMSVQNNTRWYSTTHHELGHIYYYMSYSHSGVPPILRGGANRGFHEAIGSQLGLASTQKAFLQGRGLIQADSKTDAMQALLKEALDFIVFIPWSAGVMSHYERDLYAKDLSKDAYNQRWWDYKQRYQGIAAPAARDETYCDAATKTHINNDAAQYYDYAISYILLHQFHAHVANKILKQDPHNTNSYGSKEVGEFLERVLSVGATRDWRDIMREELGQEISAKPMLDYFKPLYSYLKEVNKGRKATI